MPRLGKIVSTIVNDDNKGVFETDLDVTPTTLDPKANIRRIYSAARVPVPNIKFNAADELHSIANKQGAEFVLTELQPGAISPMHATPSVDFGVILSGEVVLVLDSGEEKIMSAGDVYVQKSTSHRWENRGTEIVTLVVVLVAAHP
ncbi:hypothetical protein SCUCBS95973_002899 [Sporothrix curviconia]|uniref:Cupin type-2 domain-containing protein n=1 Tax=Sporothrix curviconia TaxID=1260050 RepID=A0ABP0BAS8_9PEZI